MCAGYEVLAGFGFGSVFVAGAGAPASFEPLAGADAVLDVEFESVFVAPAALAPSLGLVVDVPAEDPELEVLLEAALSVL